ncbi:MAG: preprotein translocase subunit SecE [Phycisphaerae bacterium]
MTQRDSTTVAGERQPRRSARDGSGNRSEHNQRGGSGGGPSRPTARGVGGGGGFFAQYKPEQGNWTRRGTFIGLGLLVAWGAKFLYDQLAIYEGDEAWRLLITTGIPILFAVVLGAIAWRLSFVSRNSSDFMIATEGEMKKVSWSSKAEVIGSTKVVIMFTVLLALLLFIVDMAFQFIFRSIGVLRV